MPTVDLSVSPSQASRFVFLILDPSALSSPAFSCPQPPFTQHCLSIHCLAGDPKVDLDFPPFLSPHLVHQCGLSAWAPNTSSPPSPPSSSSGYRPLSAGVTAAACRLVSQLPLLPSLSHSPPAASEPIRPCPLERPLPISRPLTALRATSTLECQPLPLLHPPLLACRAPVRWKYCRFFSVPTSLPYSASLCPALVPRLF